ncbi:UNVERIFIED_CONTAM: hypothetical protein FKN15_021394 [Acipenser sinensis]
MRLVEVIAFQNYLLYRYDPAAIVILSVKGVILLAVGVWGKVSLEAYFSLVTEQSTNAPYVLIGTGAVIVIFGLFGCFATCRGSPWMLKMYSMFLALVFLAELVAGISGFLFRHEIKAVLSTTYKDAVKHYNETGPISKAVDNIQRNLHCCGSDNYTDWGSTEYFRERGIPMSCCNDSLPCTVEALKDLSKAEKVVYHQGCVKLVTTVMESNLGIIAGISFGIAFFQGCVKLVTTVMESNLGIIAGISFGIAFFQVIGIFLACCLSRYITNNQYEMV